MEAIIRLGKDIPKPKIICREPLNPPHCWGAGHVHGCSHINFLPFLWATLDCFIEANLLQHIPNWFAHWLWLMKQRSQNISFAKYAFFCVCLWLYLWQRLYFLFTSSSYGSLSSVSAVPPSSLVSLAPVNQGIVMVSFSAKLWIVSPCLIFVLSAHLITS